MRPSLERPKNLVRILVRRLATEYAQGQHPKNRRVQLVFIPLDRAARTVLGLWIGVFLLVATGSALLIVFSALEA